MDGQRRSDPASPRFALWILAVFLGLGLVAQTTQLRGLETHLDELRTDMTQGQQHQEVLRDELVEVRRDLGTLAAGQGHLRVGLGALEEGVGSVREEAVHARVLAERLEETEGRLGAIGETVEAQAGCLKNLEDAQASFSPSDLEAELEAELEARDAKLSEQYALLNAQMSEAEAKADESKRLVAALGEEVHTPRDLQQMWEELVAPVVQLAGDSSVGSGVLLESRFDEKRDTYFTYLITAWHVVRDIQEGPSPREAPVPVTIYSQDGTLRREKAHLVCYDAGIDAALLEVLTDDELPHGARIPSRAALDKVRIFDEVYAVGCPLGNDPIPTRGEISTSNHVVDDERYWMINAPTYIGNSGGGIFHSETHALLGIFSKIYTHGSVRPTIVPHMGLMTPLTTIYDWLATQGYDVVAQQNGAEGVHLVASAD